ncbi:MAG TPA: histidinol phosphate phosphatase domain-containing protein [bacterium]|nr:histidinol phosphate phosphatase domain-containing protein [bacterium]
MAKKNSVLPIIDLHTHSLFSDGLLMPAELVRHAQTAGYHAIVLTDHVEESNLEMAMDLTVRACETLRDRIGIVLVPGAEISYVPPRRIPAVAERARELGAAVLVVHGETLVEPVPPGTNEAALDADIDLLAHPGLISRKLASRAAERGISLEITTRRGHCYSNGHVCRVAREAGAMLTVNNDAHMPGDSLKPEMRRCVALGSGMLDAEYEKACRNAVKILGRRGFRSIPIR